MASRCWAIAWASSKRSPACPRRRPPSSGWRPRSGMRRCWASFDIRHGRRSPNRKLLQHRLVELDAESRGVRHDDMTVDKREFLGDQALVEVGRLDAVLHVFGLFHCGEDLQGGRLDDPGAPGMQDATPAVAAGIVRNTEAF